VTWRRIKQSPPCLKRLQGWGSALRGL